MYRVSSNIVDKNFVNAPDRLKKRRKVSSSGRISTPSTIPPSLKALWCEVVQGNCYRLRYLLRCRLVKKGSVTHCNITVHYKIPKHAYLRRMLMDGPMNFMASSSLRVPLHRTPLLSSVTMGPPATLEYRIHLRKMSKEGSAISGARRTHTTSCGTSRRINLLQEVNVNQNGWTNRLQVPSSICM